MISKRSGHPEVAENVGAELTLDAFGCFLTPPGYDRGVVDQRMSGAAPSHGEGVDGHAPGQVDELIAHMGIAGLTPDSSTVVSAFEALRQTRTTSYSGRAAMYSAIALPIAPVAAVTSATDRDSWRLTSSTMLAMVFYPCLAAFRSVTGILTEPGDALRERCHSDRTMPVIYRSSTCSSRVVASWPGDNATNPTSYC